jgi:hypothetical protein
MRYFNRSLISVVAFILIGCATGERFVKPTPPPEGKAAVYVFRERSIVGAAGASEIFINGQNLGRLPPGGYFIYYADPGEVVFSGQEDWAYVPLVMNVVIAAGKLSDSKNKPILHFPVEAGKYYFVQWMLSRELVKRDYDSAKDVLAGCALVETKISKSSQE